ncbi:hypothetical protein HDE_08106 [Halotydeus destructor]|nr:hypothetical protein HDE_08106 [Halotydeus destructor]
MLITSWTHLVIASLIGSISCQDYTDCQKNGQLLCAGLPDDCVDSESCTLLFKASFDSAKNVLNGQIYGQVSEERKYFVVGLNHGKHMAPASVMDCIVKNGAQVAIRSSFNTAEPKLTNKYSEYDEGNLTKVATKLHDGVVFCEFTRTNRIIHEGQDFTIKGNSYHLVMATGVLKDSGEKEKHHGHGNHGITSRIILSGSAFKNFNQETPNQDSYYTIFLNFITFLKKLIM